MTDSELKNDKIAHPETFYLSPSDIVRDHALSQEEKSSALSTWEQNVRELLTASNEGMSGNEEGTDDDHHRLGQRFRNSNHIMRLCRVYMSRYERWGFD